MLWKSLKISMKWEIQEKLWIIISKFQGLHLKCQLGCMTPGDYHNTEKPFLTAAGPCKSVNRNESKRNKRLHISHVGIQWVNVSGRLWGHCFSQHFPRLPPCYSAENNITGSNKYRTALIRFVYEGKLLS